MTSKNQKENKFKKKKREKNKKYIIKWRIICILKTGKKMSIYYFVQTSETNECVVGGKHFLVSLNGNSIV